MRETSISDIVNSYKDYMDDNYFISKESKTEIWIPEAKHEVYISLR